MQKIYVDRKNMRDLYRSAIIFGAILLCASCATSQSDPAQWEAHGFLTPGPTSNPEIIGVYSTYAQCITAGEAWMSRQIVGNPVFAECVRMGAN